MYKALLIRYHKPVVINYDQPWPQIFNHGYKKIAPGIKPAHFPKLRQGKNIVQAQICAFPEALSSEDIISELTRLRLQPANAIEHFYLSQLNWQVPKFFNKKNFRLIALGQVWSSHQGDKVIGAFCHYLLPTNGDAQQAPQVEKTLALYNWATPWQAHTLFLGITVGKNQS